MQILSDHCAQTDLGGEPLVASEVVLLQSRDVEIAEIGQRIVLRNRNSGAVVLSNSLGAQLMKGIKNGCDLKRLERDLSIDFDELRDARTFIRETLWNWMRAGLFDVANRTSPASKLKSAQSNYQAIFKLGRRRFQFSSESERVFRDVSSLMANYLAFDAEQNPEDTLTVSLSVDGHTVQHNNQSVWRPCSPDEARFLVIQKALSLLAGPENVSAVLHAAAVVRNDQALILAGPSGKGKTTLALLLAENGWTFAGDDMIALHNDGTKIFSLPFAARLKDNHPESISSMKESFRKDLSGTYAWPNSAATAGELFRVSAVVFPTFSANANFVEERVEPEVALQRLLTSGTEIAAPNGSVKSLTTLLNSNPTRNWTYGNGTEALMAAQTVFSKNWFGAKS